MPAEDADTPLDLVARRIGRVVRAHRRERGQSLGDLAREAGLSKSIVARIEADGGNPSVETLWRLSRALGLPLGSLIEDAGGPQVREIASRSATEMEAESGMSGWLVHSEGRARRTELFELDFPAGVDHLGTPHLPGTEELVVCVSGRMRVGPIDDERELGPGDCVVFEADVAHRYRALRASRAFDWILYRAGGM